MATDIYINPATKDVVDTVDGWVEVDNASTAVKLQLDCERDAWWGDADAGSDNGAILRSDLPTVAALKDSSQRSMRQLVAAGLISDLFVTTDEDNASGLGELLFRWFDRTSTKPADYAYSPLGGHPPT